MDDVPISQLVTEGRRLFDAVEFTSDPFEKSGAKAELECWLWDFGPTLLDVAADLARLRAAISKAADDLDGWDRIPQRFVEDVRQRLLDALVESRALPEGKET